MQITELEERGARWANIIAAFPGFYCAYVLWASRHAEPMSHYPGFATSCVSFLLLIVVGALLNFIRRNNAALPQRVETTERKDEHTAPDYVLNGYTGEEAQQNALAEHSRLLAVGNRLDGAFTNLQIDAIALAQFLQRFVDSTDPAPMPREGETYDDVRGRRYAWGIRVKTLYERDCAPQVNRFVQDAKIEMGYTSKRLDHYRDSINGTEDIETIRAQLWLFVIRSLNINFDGEV